MEPVRGALVVGEQEQAESHLRDEQRLPLSSLVIGLGFLCVLVSIGWRLARYFL